MSRVRRYSRSGLTAVHPRSPTGLSPPAVTRSSGLRLKGARAARRLPPPPAHSSNPLLASPAGYNASRVWAPPRSLAATKGILSVPRGTEMFQFPRCPLGDCAPSARPCAGRVAPFGHPRIAGCQRLPGAFRRVAASFLGRQRQGIHHAPIMRISCCIPLREDRDPRPQTGTRQRDGPVWPHLLPRRSDAPRGFVCLFFALLYGTCQCARASGHEPPPHQVWCNGRLGSGEAHLGSYPGTIALSRGRRTPRVPRGALSKCPTRRSFDPKVVRPEGRLRSSNLVRSRLPTSDELSQPRGGPSDRTWHHWHTAGVPTDGRC
jgi:hypothetical protein